VIALLKASRYQCHEKRKKPMEGSLKFLPNKGIKAMLNDDMFFYWMDTSGVGVDGGVIAGTFSCNLIWQSLLIVIYVHILDTNIAP
jgi:hypothetical protein